ncbi:4'-phosphopantetheinyl transferase superfamily protein [Photobacterium frigidiphilum]|uniref:4'-phosphopantetheinyl transferase family protein n=1 Tax=Photobacterium frigidiphilum TaxID=264736 RepID=UPI003D14692E
MNPPYISQVMPVVLPNFSGVCFQCEFDPELYTIEAPRQLGIILPETLHGAVKKRQAEYVAGRYLAKRCLVALGRAEADVGISQHRAPLWPKEIIGSISHSSNKAICVLNQCDLPEQGIGIDIEQCLTDGTAMSIKNTIINEAEQALITKHDIDFSTGLTVVFSAKESLFKALFPQVRAYFDFLDAEVIAMERDNLTIMLKKTLASTLSVGCKFTVQIHKQNMMVRTFTQS